MKKLLFITVILLASCDRLQGNYVPKKPFTIIDKYENAWSTSWTIVYVDSAGKRLSFETEFFNEDRYTIGQIIK